MHPCQDSKLSKRLGAQNKEAVIDEAVIRVMDGTKLK